MISKKLIAFSGVALASLAAGLSPSRVQSGTLFESASYYFIFTLFFLWSWRVISLYATAFKNRLVRHYPILLLAVVLTALIYVSSPPRFKVLADETNLIGVSMMMHEKRSATLPIEGVHTDYRNSDFLTVPDKRPVLFPFLVSIVHALRGYAATNGFILNFAVSCVILFLIYLTTARILPDSYGWVAVLLAAGTPVYMINVTSSGFEALNLLFLLLYFLFLIDTVQSGGEVGRIELLIMTTLLLAQCRYESAAFILITAILLMPLMLKSRFFSRMSCLGCSLPVFLMPLLWQRKFFLDHNEFNKIGHETFEYAAGIISLRNLWSNFDDNIFVLLGLNPHYGFTPILAGAAILGSYLLIKSYIGRNPLEMQPLLPLTVLVSAVVLFLIISSFFWGNFGLKMDNRLSLIFLPFLLWPAAYAFHRIEKRNAKRLNTVMILAAVFHLAFFWSYGTQQRLVNNLSLQFEYNRVLDHLERRYPKNGSTLIIAEQPNLYVIHQYSAMRFNRSDKLMEILSSPNSVDHIIALQKIDRQTGRVAAGSVLQGPFQTRRLAEFSLSPELAMRISECTFINGPGNSSVRRTQ